MDFLAFIKGIDGKTVNENIEKLKKYNAELLETIKICSVEHDIEGLVAALQEQDKCKCTIAYLYELSVLSKLY